MLKNIYKKMFAAYGPQQWWPAETPFEMIVGAILTQNTNWTNVEKAIGNLKSAGILTPHGIRDRAASDLAALIRPSGYFNIKSRRLKAFISFLYDHFDGQLDRLFSLELKTLRHQLLAVKGIGPETADSILLYAGSYPVFVVDAYTKRIFSRIGLLHEAHTYHQVQAFFMDALDRDVKLYNEYHALIVRHAKMHCRKKPACLTCPLLDIPCIYGTHNIQR